MSERNHTTRRPARAGFTLIEIMVVVFIIGILLALVVGVERYVREEAARKRTEATQAIVMSMVDSFKEQFGVYPANDLLVRCLAGTLENGTQFKDVFGRTPAANELQAVNSKIKSMMREKLSKLPRDAYDVNDTTATDIRDGFGTPMRYDAAGGMGGRPVLISAGHDRRFGENDPKPGGGTYPNDESKTTDNIRSDGR